MEISPRKTSRRAQEPVDEWLQDEGFFRKHAPRDPTCLFRAVSEQVYLTQYYHLRVRKECVEFMRNNRHMFEEFIKPSFDTHLEQMAYFTEWGGMNEIQALSLLYRKEFVIFNGQKQIRTTVTDNGFEDIIYLCHTPQKQYESVYVKDYAVTASFCQSIVYQMLYKDVFKISNVEGIVNKMLHDRNTVFRHHKFFLKENQDIREQLSVELFNKVDTNANQTQNTQYQKSIPPFPYRVAKALDPNIYRNIEFDIWHEIRREVKSAGWNKHNSHVLQVGGRCLVQVQVNQDQYDKVNNNDISLCSSEKDANGNETKIVQRRTKGPLFLRGHIQEMTKNQGPVLVYIEELGEKKSVPYTALKPIPLKKNRLQFLPIYQKSLQMNMNSSSKWKNGTPTGVKRIKGILPSISDSYDKNDNRAVNVSNINKKCYALNQWNEESIDGDEQSYEEFAVEKYDEFTRNDSSETYTSTIMIQDNDASVTEISNQDTQKNSRCPTPTFTNLPIENGNDNRQSKAITNHSESCSESNSPMQQRDAYYPLYNENSENNPNTNPMYPIVDGNSFNQMDRALREINYSVPKSVDENGQDLPLSDPFTLRFFYNLGLEFFRSCNTWNYPQNGQPVAFGQWYQGAPTNDVSNLANGIQDCNITEKPEEQSKNSRRDRHSIVETSPPTRNIPRDMKPIRNTNPRESNSNRDKAKDHTNGNKDGPRMHRNSLAPRFKRNADNRNRNGGQQNNSSYQHINGQHHNPRPINGYNGQKQQEPRNENLNPLNSNASQPVHMPVSPPAYPPYMQQGLMPYYGSETDAFGNPYYPPSPGFYQVPCIPHSEVHDNSNIPPFQSQIYSGMDYTQAFPGVCSPFMYPPPSPCVTPQNIPEHWYAQPPYMQFASVVPVPPESPCNMQNQIPNLTGSP